MHRGASSKNFKRPRISMNQSNESPYRLKFSGIAFALSGMCRSPRTSTSSPKLAMLLRLLFVSLLYSLIRRQFHSVLVYYIDYRSLIVDRWFIVAGCGLLLS